ncbi:hypothetical protein M0811_13535 [Anaeramoeba ignava]|uniref:Uncharacterized protein n=1 Tax=Anaeramoeba ignava TaxID=1746090 RepID=A0A9Q0R582_ANAIG|nr:hypothetical protein M0811_13535 [Anaeramoeba ignava]
MTETKPKKQKNLKIFLQHQPNGTELNKLWNQRKKKHELGWYFDFASLFIRSYYRWNPNSQQFLVDGSSRFEQIFLQEQIKEAVLLDLAQPPSFVRRTSFTLYSFQEDFKLFLGEKQLHFSHMFKKDFIKSKSDISDSNDELTHSSEETLYLSNQIQKKFDFRSAIAFDVVLILSRSKFNRQGLLESQFFELLLGCLKLTNLFLEQTRRLEIFDKSSLIAEPVLVNDLLLINFLISNILDSFSSFLNPYDEVIEKNSSPQIQKYTNWFKDYQVFDSLIETLEKFIYLGQTTILTSKHYEIELKFLNIFDLFMSYGMLSENDAKSFIDNFVSSFKPKDSLLETIMDQEKKQQEYFSLFTTETVPDIYKTNYFDFYERKKNDSGKDNFLFISLYQANILEFQTKMRILQVIQKFSLSKSPIQQILFSNQSFDYLTDFVLWVSMTFPSQWIEKYIKYEKQLLNENLNQNQNSNENLNLNQNSNEIVKNKFHAKFQIYFGYSTHKKISVEIQLISPSGKPGIFYTKIFLFKYFKWYESP